MNRNQFRMQSTSFSLLNRLKQPSPGADWRRFVDLYTPLLYHWVRRQGVRSSDAGDVVQDVFAVLVEKLPRFDYDADGSFRAWLRTVAMNQCRDLHRKIKHRKGDVSIDLIEPTQGDDIELFAAAEYSRVLAQRALELMKSEFETKSWKACWESVVANRPTAEISQELKMSANSVYLAKSRVLRRLRSELDGLLD